MSQKLKYLGLFLLVVFGGFQVYIQLQKSKKLKPTLYIDNFSGADIVLMDAGEVWLELENNTSQTTRALKAGAHILFAKKEGTGEVDTLKVTLKEKRTYVLNLFNAMQYYEGSILYQSNPGKQEERQISGETAITKSFFETTTDYVFEEPPSTVQMKKNPGAPASFNYKKEATYLRRGNASWANLSKVATALEVPITTSAPSPPKQESGMSSRLRQQSLDYLGAGKVAEALEVLGGFKPNEANQLKNRLKELEKQQKLGTIAFDGWALERNRIAYAVLELLPKSTKLPTSIPVEQLQPYVDKGALTEALDVLIDAGYEDAVLAKGRLEILSREKQRGTIPTATINMMEARIKQAILAMGD